MNQWKKLVAKPLLFSAAALLFAALVAACADPGKDVKKYVLIGKVVEVEKADSALVVDMDAIPGYMEAMTMSVHVKDAAQLDGLSRGDAIRGSLVVHANGSWLEDVRLLTKAR